MRESILQEDKDSSIVKPEMKIALEKKDSMQQSEKQISVDPTSLRESTTNVYRPPKMEVIMHDLLPPAVSAGKSTSKFMRCRLPNPASSSPTTSFAKHKNKLKKNHDEQLVSPLSRQHSVALSNLERLRESHLRRSKSCGEGRACQPSVDFDLWSVSHQTVTRADKEVDHEKITIFRKKKLEVEPCEDKFKCGACLFLPGFGGKGKAVRARKEGERGIEMGHIDIVSQRVSLEKFECGSWRSSAVINIEEEDAGDIFFDLPVELIRCSSVNDTVSPVTTGFLFDNSKDQQNHHHHLKGVLKNTTTVTPNSGSGQLARRKSPESCNLSRHVRFSTSSPATSPTSCITPRLDLNAFLEAQS